MKKVSLLLLLTIVALVFGCKKDSDDSCDTTNMTYTADIKTILDKNCALSGCHAANSLDGEMNNYANASFTIALQNLDGTFLDAIKWEGTASKMPKGGSQLSDCDIAKLEAWVKAGLPE